MLGCFGKELMGCKNSEQGGNAWNTFSHTVEVAIGGLDPANRMAQIPVFTTV